MHALHNHALISVVITGFAIASFDALAVAPAEVVANLQSRMASKPLTFRVVPNMCKKVYVTVGNREYYYLHKESRFFPAKTAIPGVRITRLSLGSASSTTTRTIAKPGNDSAAPLGPRNFIRVEFEHPHLRKGEIKIARNDGQPIEDAEAVVHVLGYAFEVGSLPPHKLFVGDQKTKLLYFAGVNHLPPLADRVGFDTKEEAERAGYKPTLLSFARIPQIPSYETEFMLGLQTSSAVRTYSPPDTDDA